MANRQRKVQSAQVGTGRVANTTTSNTQAVYRIPTGRNNRECDVLAYEVLGVAPIEVRIEGNNVYRVSLDSEALKSLIESTPLDFSNVGLTLGTVNGAVEFTGNITADGTFTGTTINATDIDTNSLNSASITTVDITATNANIAKLNATELEASTATISEATISVENTEVATIQALTATTAVVNSTLDVHGGVDVNGGVHVLDGDLVVEEDEYVKGTSNIHKAEIEELNVTTTATLAEAEVTGNTKVNTLTATGTSTLADTVISKDLTVAGNTTMAGTTTMVGDVNAKNVSTSGVLTTNGTTVMNGSVEAHNNVTVDGTLRANGNVEVKQSLTVEEQINTENLRADDIVTDELRVNKGLYLNEDAIAPELVLQKEKGVANGVASLDNEGKIKVDQLPAGIPTVKFAMGTGVFTNSNTCVIEDENIRLNSYVNISNYNDIIGDLNEVIWEGGITVTSNETETGSVKYFVVTPLD